MTDSAITTAIAIYGAFIASIGGLWNIYQWWNRGPILRGRYAPNMVFYEPGASNENKPSYFIVSVANVGTAQTTITNFGVIGYDTVLKYFFGKPSFTAVIPKNMPQYPVPFDLAIGKEWKGMMMQNDESRNLSRSKLLCFVIYHSFSEKPLKVRIRPLPLLPLEN